MTSKQKLELRLSEIRSRLNVLGGTEQALSESETSEVETLSVEFQDTETRFRAAVIAEGENNGGGGGENRRVEDSESAEIRQLSEKVELRRYLEAAASRGSLDGAESELKRCSAHPECERQRPMGKRLFPSGGEWNG